MMMMMMMMMIKYKEQYPAASTAVVAGDGALLALDEDELQTTEIMIFYWKSSFKLYKTISIDVSTNTINKRSRDYDDDDNYNDVITSRPNPRLQMNWRKKQLNITGQLLW